MWYLFFTVDFKTLLTAMSGTCIIGVSPSSTDSRIILVSVALSALHQSINSKTSSV
jgi:hypothetical protein